MALLLLAFAPGSWPKEPSQFDEVHRFIFYAVLEGLYDDGVSNGDVDRILLKGEKEYYFHFVYACPVCTPTIDALLTLKSFKKNGSVSYHAPAFVDLDDCAACDGACEKNWMDKP